MENIGVVDNYDTRIFINLKIKNFSIINHKKFISKDIAG
ncbi:hypothetical protein ASZ90_008549 [hydrocarbon metagenome]|uniref:Uncharacterized protein n=1 Tax=hydrocarbon metagenome TaxID=938273 RepID=A0A0W8FLB2_9ZZZZ